MTKYIQRLVNLELPDFQLVRRVAIERGLGGKGFSAALRMIIREWASMRRSSLIYPDPGSNLDPPSDN